MGPLRRYSLFLLTLLCHALLLTTAMAQKPDVADDAVSVKQLNSGLPRFSEIANDELTTPERSLSYFVRCSRQGDFLSACYVLDLDRIPSGDQLERGPELARKLYRVMDRQTGYPFGSLPDRPDGEAPLVVSASGPQEHDPRGIILLDTLPLDVGQFEIYLTRYRSEAIEGAWLFAPTTVDLIDEAYLKTGPREWERALPQWLKGRTPGQTPLWGWLLLFGSVFVVWLAISLLKKLSDRFFRKGLVDKLFVPFRVAMATWIPYFALQWWVPVPRFVLYLMLFTGFVGLVSLLSSILDYYATQIVRKDIESVKDLDHFKHRDDKRKLTYLSVGRRLLSFLVLTLGVGAVAVKTPLFDALGMTLLASAGVLSVILGIAAQPILGNMISGAQIALSRPVRVGDAILYNDDWCYVEEITFMYVSCRTWDERRLIVPLSTFVKEPFSSYSLRNPRTLRVLDIPLDFSVDVERLRRQLKLIAERSGLWADGFEPKVEVVDFTERGVTVRAQVMANNAADSWDLACQVREKLLDYLQTEQREALPRLRVGHLEATSAAAAKVGEKAPEATALSEG